jgi:SAM-dependent methyltransferase
MLDDYLQILFNKNEFQRKKYEKFADQRNETYIKRANEFFLGFDKYLALRQRTREEAVDSYLKLCSDMVLEQIKFMKTGNYSLSNQSTAFDSIYNNEERMATYMEGLALSQFFWESHYRIFDFFLTEIATAGKHVKNYLEIGPGHGLYLAHAINNFEQSEIVALDISKTSLKLAKEMVGIFTSSVTDTKYVIENVEKYTPDELFDFITMAEVIEHLDDPKNVLIKIRNMLSEEGVAFLTTCVNCPAIDHIYLFSDVKEIQSMFKECGLEILREKILPVEKLPMVEIMSKKICINYAATVRAKND